MLNSYDEAAGVILSKPVSKKDIMNQVHILDLIDEFGLSVDNTFSGNSFDFRMICPSKDHKNGAERTPSLYINSETNSFKCFGCQAGSNVIDFYMICTEDDFKTSVTELSKRVENPTGDGYGEINIDNLSILLEISKLFKFISKKYSNDDKWQDSFMKKVDIYISDISKSDIESAKKLLKSVKKEIRKRYS